MTIAHVIGSANSGVASGVLSDILDSSGANLCLIGSGDWDAYSDPTTVADTKGNTYGELPGQSVHHPDIGQQSRIFYCANPTVGAGHQISVSRNNYYGSASFEFFSGAAWLYPFEAYNGAALGFGSSSIQPGPMSPMQNGDMIFTSVCSPNVSVTIDEGFSAPLVTDATIDSYGEASAYLIQGAAASVNPTWAYPGADGLCATWAIIRAQTEPGLEAWWKLDEGTGVTAHDSSGNGNHMTLAAETAWATGQNGPCVSLPGDNDYLYTTYGGPPSYTQLTLAAWIARATVGAGDAQRGGLIVKTNGGSWNYELIIGFVTDGISFYSDGLFPNTGSSNSDVLTVANEWHHVAVVVDLPNIIFYVDGVLAGGYSVVGTMVGNVGEPVLLGNENGGAPDVDFFNGRMADARIYNYPLTAPQVLAIAARPAPTIISAAPSGGNSSGGDSVVISGTGFYQVTGVTFDGVPATGITTNSDLSVSVITPAHVASVVNIVVTNVDGQSASAVAAFTYSAPTHNDIDEIEAMGERTEIGLGGVGTGFGSRVNSRRRGLI